MGATTVANMPTSINEVILTTRHLVVCILFDLQRSSLSPRIVDVAQVNQGRCLEESVQWLENVERTHLVLDSGKLVLQKMIGPKVFPLT